MLISVKTRFISQIFHSEALVQSLGRSHGALDVERADVLPVLLQQRHEEVDAQVDVLHQLVGVHVHVAHSHVQAQNLK